MSNCYTHFRKVFVPLHEEQRKWLEDTVAVCLHWDSNDNTVTIASDESGDPDDALCLIAEAQRVFDDPRPWGFCWAFTADRGPSSGGAAVVKNGVVTYMPDQHAWLREHGVKP